MPSLGTIGGHQGAPGPTRKRALAYQAKTDLVADTPRQYQQPGAAKKFHTRRAGTTGEQLEKRIFAVSYVAPAYSVPSAPSVILASLSSCRGPRPTPWTSCIP